MAMKIGEAAAPWHKVGMPNITRAHRLLNMFCIPLLWAKTAKCVVPPTL